MRPHSLPALILAAAIASPATAGEGKLGPSEALFLSTASVAILPFYMLSAAGVHLSQQASKGIKERGKRWEVTNVAPQGERTAVELRSEDKELKIAMTVPTATVRAQGVQLHDQVEIEPIGKAGYAVSKGAATIGVLAQPDSGMLHSQPRN